MYYRQYVVEKIPESLHSLMPLNPQGNFRYEDPDTSELDYVFWFFQCIYNICKIDCKSETMVVLFSGTVSNYFIIRTSKTLLLIIKQTMIPTSFLVARTHGNHPI